MTTHDKNTYTILHVLSFLLTTAADVLQVDAVSATKLDIAASLATCVLLNAPGISNKIGVFAPQLSYAFVNSPASLTIQSPSSTGGGSASIYAYASSTITINAPFYTNVGVYSLASKNITVAAPVAQSVGIFSLGLDTATVDISGVPSLGAPYFFSEVYLVASYPSLINVLRSDAVFVSLFTSNTPRYNITLPIVPYFFPIGSMGQTHDSDDDPTNYCILP